MRFGVITPPVSGHLHPFGALGRELVRRGHQVSVFHMADLAGKVARERLDFCPIGNVDHPLGSLEKAMAELTTLDGLRAVRFTVRAVRKTTEMMLRDGPPAMRAAGIQALLVDQMEPAGGTMAEHLGIPFITVCNALLLNAEPRVPPPFTAWGSTDGFWARLRNRVGYGLSRRTLKPVMDVVQERRATWGLRQLAGPDDSYSPIAQICQQPAAFDFPRRQLPSHFHYVGPLRDRSTAPADFPWHRLDGRPIVYASLGTLQNRRADLFRLFAEACQGLNVQLVMTHGGGLQEAECTQFPGEPLVVSYAPQLEMLSRARLALTHAGLNTVLDSLSCGVPLVALPITYEQPAIASRIRWAGVGAVVSRRGLTAALLRRNIDGALKSATYLENARRLQSEIAQSGGITMAADVIEKILGVDDAFKRKKDNFEPERPRNLETKSPLVPQLVSR